MAFLEPGFTEKSAEIAKFDKPYVYEPFPSWLTKVTRVEGHLHFEEILVQNDAEEQRWRAEGFVRGGEAGAKAELERLEQVIAAAAAETAGQATKMGRKARDEFWKRESTADEHVTE